MKNISKTTKTILFASLIAALILPFSGIDYAEAKTDDRLKSDTDLFIEADNLEKQHKEFKYDKNGKNVSGESNDHKRHQDIVEELNSRGIFHKSQDQQLMMESSPSNNGHGHEHQAVDVFLLSPVGSNIETNDSVCCGGSHNKKLSIKSGMEWNSPTFPWWEYRVESSWSSFTPTSVTATSMISGNEVNVRPYVTVKADHAVTWADFQVGSEVFVKDIHGNYVSLGLNTGTYSNIYFATLATENTGMFPNEPSLPALAKHTTEIQITSIS